jgi:hypothetical protein
MKEAIASKEVFDPIRQAWVAATPEEVVRQMWIQRMIGELKFPRELLAVEKELRALPHLAQEKNTLPNRRIDLLSFMNTTTPLLLIECKAEELTDEALNQAISYNHYVKAPYVAIVNGSDIRFCYQQKEISRLPTYLELVEAL